MGVLPHPTAKNKPQSTRHVELGSRKILTARKEAIFGKHSDGVDEEDGYWKSIRRAVTEGCKGCEVEGYRRRGCPSRRASFQRMASSAEGRRAA